MTRGIPTRFEDRLLAELLPLVSVAEPAGGLLAGEQEQGRPRRPRPVRAGSRPAGRVAAVLGLLLLVLGGAGVGAAVWPRQLTRPAYAVQEQADGSLLVTVNDIADPSGLQDMLVAHGVSATVLVVRPGATCPAPVTGVPAPGAIQGVPDHTNVLAIRPDLLPAGTTAVLGLLGSQSGGSQSGGSQSGATDADGAQPAGPPTVLFAVVRGPAPSCFPGPVPVPDR